MTRIFLTLTFIANGALAVTFLLGLRIDDPASLEPGARNAVTWHLLTALAAALLVLLVHAVALTYFMGTGRWLEETCAAYRLGTQPRETNIRLKYRVIPGMVACIGLVVGTGALGAMADPAANFQLEYAASLHLGLAITTLLGNLWVSVIEHRAISENGAIVDAVVDEVRTIRREHGLEA